MASPSIQHAFDLALQHHQAGRLEEAEGIYRKILAEQPDHAEAMHCLGLIAHAVGRNDIAVELIRQAIGIKPDFAEAQYSLATILGAERRLDEAIATYRRVIALVPDLPMAYSNLGTALKDNGQLDEAIAAYRQAIALEPDYAVALYNLGVALSDKGQLDEAIAAYRRAIACEGDYFQAHCNLGNALHNKGESDEAIAAYRQAIALNPNLPEAYNNLGTALKDKGKLDEAIAAHRRAIDLRPNYAKALSNLGVALGEKEQLDEAIAAYRRAIAINPDFAEAWSNLGNALKEQGQLDEAIDSYRQAITIDPEKAWIGSNLIYAMHFDSGCDARAIADEHRRWNRQHAEPLRKFIQPHANDRGPDRRLRIGYVSPDLRQHVVGRNLLPLLQHHDRAHHEIFCYASVLRPDDMTEQLRTHGDVWRNVLGLGDEELAEKIRADRIDILVDLTVHMAANRLPMFARKPAPVQVTYLGYCGSTGMSAMDYRLSDPYLDPPEADLSCHSEKTVRLPRTYWCYPSGPALESSPPPFLENKFVTFGCLNNFAKVSIASLDLWAKILLVVPNSRLILHARPSKHLDEVARRMEQAGMTRDRLIFVGLQPWTSYAQTYSRIDIALDPFPYGGGITTCDALWMGVPVVTLSGQTAVGRGGRSILSNLGLPELIAFTPDQYVQITIDLARDGDRLMGLRRGMRDRMLASPLMDARSFAHDMECAYRQMWEAWREAPFKK